MMQYEVERKFRIDSAEALAARLVAIGAQPCGSERHVDRYFNHPSRDYALTDEALRIRSKGDQNFVTYKGPKVDTITKTRRELELPIESGAAGAHAFGELLVALGFRHVADVAKRRQVFELTWRGRRFEAAIDDVDELGWFVELETSAGGGTLASARGILAALVDELELTRDERRSYLQLLLERRGAATAAAKPPH